MANFRRRKPRIRQHSRRWSETSLRARVGLPPQQRWRFLDNQEDRDRYRAQWAREIHIYNWLSNWPRWHDLLFHTRPQRRATKRLEHVVLRDCLDPDDISWPVPKKPHKYYW